MMRRPRTPDTARKKVDYPGKRSIVSREASNRAFFVAMKTNKSFSKRLRVTKHGKIISRVPGQNHFNAKESGSGRQKRRRDIAVKMTSALRSRFLPSSN